MTRTSTAALLLVVSAFLTACGDDAAEVPAPAEQTASNGDVYNGADVDFAAQMIPHHADALVMVDMTQGRDLSPELAGLTEDIRDAQAPEIETMVDWLTAWGEEVPATSRDHVNSHGGDHGSDEGTADGMDMGMDAEDMAALESVEGEAFETMWLQMMVEHHEGAVEMAQDQQRDGVFPDAVSLAESIESGQSEEIELMESLLAG